MTESANEENTVEVPIPVEETRTRSSIGTGKLSWADKAKAEAELMKRSSIWDKFDVSKISNVGFKLDYVASAMHGEVPVCEIKIDDISTEILY